MSQPVEGAGSLEPKAESLVDHVRQPMEDDNNSLEPGEVVTPPHQSQQQHPPHPAKQLVAKDLASKNLRKLTQLDPDGKRHENGLLETSKSQINDADDSEGLYSDTDSSGEEQKTEVEDVQQARKEKKAEAAAAALPQPPPTPFLGISPLRFHMRPPCYDFPRMGFMPRMGRGGPRGMRPLFFGRPLAPNRMVSPLEPQGPVGPKRPQSDVVWTTLQPSIPYVFNLISECDNFKHKDCKHTAPTKPKEPANDVKDKPAEHSLGKDEKRSRGKTRERSKARADKKKTKEKSKEKERRGNTREKSNDKGEVRGKTRERSAGRNLTKNKTKESFKEKDQIQGTEKPEKSQERGKTKERAREEDHNSKKIRHKSRGRSRTRTKTRERSKGKEHDPAVRTPERNVSRGKTRDRSREQHQLPGKTSIPAGSSERGKTRERSKEKDQVRGKTRERSPERSLARGKTMERPTEKDQARGKTRERSKEPELEKRGNVSQNFHERGKTRERSREPNRMRGKTRERSRSKPREKSGDRPKESVGNQSNDKPRDKSNEKRRDKTNDKLNEKPRERSMEKHRERSKQELGEKLNDSTVQGSKGQGHNTSKDSVEKQKDKSRDNSKDSQRERNKTRDRSTEKSKRYSGDKGSNRSLDKPRGRSREKSPTRNPSARDHSREDHFRARGPDRDRFLPREGHPGTPRANMFRREATPHDSFQEKSRKRDTKAKTDHRNRSRSRTRWGSREGTPTMTPPPEQLPQTHDNEATKVKVFDIFADSPPRSNTAVVASAASIDRSTTPPLKASLDIPKPLLKASEIHSRIGALLEDNDLHLDALLATKEQLLRRTNEYKEKKESKLESQSNMNDKRSGSRGQHHSREARHTNTFKSQSVLSERRRQRNGSQSTEEENWDDDLEPAPSQFKDVTIKVEKDLTPPPQATSNGSDLQSIKVERSNTPAGNLQDREVLLRNGAVAANAPPPSKEQESPDTDDYIDNWENDDSMASYPKNAPRATPTSHAPNPFSSLNSTPLPQETGHLHMDDDDSNALWNANSTPPPRSKNTSLPNSNIHEMYDKFMNSIQMTNVEEDDTTKVTSFSDGSSSGSESSTTSSSSSDSEEETSSAEEEDPHSSDEETGPNAAISKANSDEQTGKDQQQKKNSVSKDLRKLKSLEDNLARIQMMRENYDAGDEISEELLKMESLFLMQRNAIMDKYRKHELKASGEENQTAPEDLEKLSSPTNPPAEVQSSPTPVNNIFDANREAIKLTISPLKLTRKSAILDKDDAEQPPPSKLAQEPVKKPPKEIAIVKPTIVESRSKPRLRSPPPPGRNRRLPRDRSRSRSISRNRSRHRSLRASRGKDGSRSPSPRRWRPPSPKRGFRFGKKSGMLPMGRSHSRSMSRSRTRSRSPGRRRRPPGFMGNRWRGSLSPGPQKIAGPRSPPPPRLRRSLSRERDRDRDRDRERFSRSPLPFKPPSPPMRRSWSNSHSRSPTRRRSISRSRSRSPRCRSRSPYDERQSFMDYFEENPGMEAAAYFYNMSLLQQEHQDPTGESYDAYAAYMDSAYNMEQAYAQYGDGYGLSNEYSDYIGPMEGVSSPQLTGSVLRELPMAPVPGASVVVQKGNVLEIVPSSNEPDAAPQPAAIEEPPEDSTPKRKRVNFVDNVLPNYESDSEDRAVVRCAVERALRLHQERRAQAAAKLQQVRDELLALPPPPPPLTPKPPNLEKPVLVQKKPRFRYFHFDPVKGVIVKSHTRQLRPLSRPPFDPKQFAMLMKSGRLPPMLPAFFRHRPPPIPANVDPVTRAAMLKDFFTKHPPPPLQMHMPMPLPHDALPFFVSGPPPMAAGGPQSSPIPVIMPPQPIPVLGYQGYSQRPGMVSSPGPLPVPVPAPVTPILRPVPAPVPPAPTSPPSTYFSPPPLPALPTLPILPSLTSSFTVNAVPTITEIMPVDILQQIGPLPKTLDVDDVVTTSSLEETSNDFHTETPTTAVEQPVVEAKPQLLVETQ
ncbi:hypothetical protein KR074_000498 [Drosophila pseudoananassae]|nr:hypothetical protein KR074_000498 [Drosophila pseudoananassae]